MFAKIKEPILVSIFKEIHKTQKKLNQLEKEYNGTSASQENIIDDIIEGYITNRNKEFERLKITITALLSSMGIDHNDYFMKLKIQRLGDPKRWPSKFGGPWGP